MFLNACYVHLDVELQKTWREAIDIDLYINFTLNKLDVDNPKMGLVYMADDGGFSVKARSGIHLVFFATTKRGPIVRPITIFWSMSAMEEE